VIRRRAIFAAIALFTLTGCGECERRIDCGLRHDFASCARGPDCLATNRCAPGGGAGQCVSACVPLGPTCSLRAAAQNDDGCMLDLLYGHDAGCISTDHDPDRCTLVKGKNGRPACVDARPPCAGCAMNFDGCLARNHCTGVICF
jgi:hypothetical protein